MSGPRDYDWKHTRVVGDRDAAVPYLAFANKLLGFVKQEAARNGLGVHQITRKLNDGTIVVAEIHGSIPRITIVPKGAVTDGIHWIEGFVLASSYRDVKPVIVAPGKEGKWRHATNYAAAYPRYHAIEAGALSTSQDKPFLRGGDTYHENDDGEVVSWYFSGGCRHFYQEMVEPTLMFDRYVTHRGKVLFNALEYAQKHRGGEGKPHVLAAAVKDKWLYLISADMNYVVEFDVPDSAGFVGDTFITPQWNNGDQAFLLWRIKLQVRQSLQTGALEYFVTGDHETLLEGSAHNAHGPWCFSRDLSHVVMHAHPDEARYIWRMVPGTPYDYPANIITPSETHKRHYIDLTTCELTTSDASEVIAEDSGKALKLVKTSAVSWAYEYEGAQYPALNILTGQTWELDYADLVNGWFVFGGNEGNQKNTYNIKVRGPKNFALDHQLFSSSDDPDGSTASTTYGDLDTLSLDGLAVMSLRAHGPTKDGADGIQFYVNNPDAPVIETTFAHRSIAPALARTSDFPNVSYGGAVWDVRPSPHHPEYRSFDKYGTRSAPLADVPGPLHAVLETHITHRRMVRRDFSAASNDEDVIVFYGHTSNGRDASVILSSRDGVQDKAMEAFPQGHAFSIYPLGKPPKGQPAQRNNR